jgi:uncharacterized membrane protein
MNQLLARDAIVVFFGICVLTLGVILLYDGITTPDVLQTTKIIAGAAFLSSGFFVLRLIFKHWWKWRKALRHSRNA